MIHVDRFHDHSAYIRENSKILQINGDLIVTRICPVKILITSIETSDTHSPATNMNLFIIHKFGGSFHSAGKQQGLSQQNLKQHLKAEKFTRGVTGELPHRNWIFSFLVFFVCMRGEEEGAVGFTQFGLRKLSFYGMDVQSGLHYTRCHIII